MLTICVIISISVQKGSSGSSEKQNGASECGTSDQINEKAMAFLFLRAKYLGQEQGKHNVLKFLEFFCVNKINNVKIFAYYSRFKSNFVRMNNIVYFKYNSRWSGYIKCLKCLNNLSKVNVETKEKKSQIYVVKRRVMELKGVNV